MPGGPAGLLEEPEPRVPGSCRALGNNHSVLCIAVGLRAVLRKYWPGSMPGPPDFLRCWSGLEIDLDKVCTSNLKNHLTYRVIIWECILNKHTARISIDRHSETLYTVRTPKVGHFICDRKRFDVLKGWLTGLDQSGAPLCGLTRLGSTSDVFGFSPQVNPASDERHISPCTAALCY